MKYLTHKQVIFVNGHIINKYTPEESIGVQDEKMLDSAIMRPQQSVGGQDAYSTLERKAAALFASLAQNHPFHNANKRTALSCLHLFLHLNGFYLRVAEKNAEDFTVRVVVEKPDLTEIENWIRQHIVAMEG
jgi:death on curing protein